MAAIAILAIALAGLTLLSAQPWHLVQCRPGCPLTGTEFCRWYEAWVDAERWPWLAGIAVLGGFGMLLLLPLRPETDR